MALTDSQRSACETFAGLIIKQRKHMHVLSTVLCAQAQAYPTVKQWLTLWSRSAIQSAEEYALLRDIHIAATNEDPAALAVVELTIPTIIVRRITS